MKPALVLLYIFWEKNKNVVWKLTKWARNQISEKLSWQKRFVPIRRFFEKRGLLLFFVRNKQRREKSEMEFIWFRIFWGVSEKKLQLSDDNGDPIFPSRKELSIRAFTLRNTRLYGYEGQSKDWLSLLKFMS